MEWNYTGIDSVIRCFVKSKVVLLLMIMAFLFSNQANATHAAGADLTYKSLGGLVYQIEATFYRDCGGSSEPGNVTISYKSATCGYSRSVLANKVLIDNGQEITMPCATSNSTCNGGLSTGIRQWVYRTVVTLPSACSDWVFSYRVCCRNCTVTTIQSPCAVNSEIYVEATLNNLEAPGNSSPEFHNMPIAFVCLGQNFNYNQGVYDIDGDSLAYELITPKISDTTEVTWLAPATTQAPLASSTPFSLNPVTGDINFTPSTMQIGILAIRVNEFRNGQPIGSTIRDMQVYIQNCFNSIPVAGGIDGTGNYMTSVCAGQQLCFTVSAQDIDSTQTISFSTYNPIQGSTITQTSGNLPAMQFCWTPTVADISRQPHVFTLTIFDDACPVNGMQTFSYAIFVNGPIASISVIDPACGMNTGSANAVVTNQSGCTYSWNTIPPQFTPTASGLTPGNYSVTVTDQQGCSSVFDATVNANSGSVQVACTSTGIISCQSGNNGTAQATVVHGVFPYTYIWNTGAPTPFISGLGAGTYYVTVTDAAGCTATDSTVIPSAPGNLVSQVSIANQISCYAGNNGVVSAVVSGGLSPYTYSWSNGCVAQINNGLSAGNYTVLVTDVNGCTATTAFSMNQPASPLSASFVSNFINCFGGNNGGLNVFANGGFPPYVYNWSTGATTQNISGLSSGNYSVLISDFNGCSAIFTASVSQPLSPLIVNVVNTRQVTCFGGDDGVLDVMVSGGDAPYNFAWSHGSSDPSATNLEAGVYNVTVTDANGCITVGSATVLQPAAPVIGMVAITSNVTCFGGANGVLDLTVTGGTAPYSFTWSNGYTGQNLENVQAGTYQVTITDTVGCSTIANAIITQPAGQVDINLTAQQILCFNGNNGSVSASVIGGVGTLNYLWNNGANTPQISGLGSGTYSVTVTDGNGCSSVESVIITQPSAPLIPVISLTQPVFCHGQAGGMLSLEVSGGTVPYTFQWSNGAVSQNASNIMAGTYTVTITDANGCNAIISAFVSGPNTPLSARVALVQEVFCFGDATGSLTAMHMGGEAPYSYLWNTGAQTASLSQIPAGSYSVTITDKNGCTATGMGIVTQPLAGITISGSVTGANCLSGVAGSIVLSLSGGIPGYTYVWSNGSTTQNINEAAPGIYSVVVTDASGCTVSSEYEISGELNFSLTASGPTVICAGETITLTADSVADAVYQWFYDGNQLQGVTGMQFMTPAAGVYTVNVTNNCGTFNSNEIEVVVKTIGNVSINKSQVICPPETAQLFATGGVTYEWTPASYITFTNVPDPFVSPMTTTRYSVLITNEWGCKVSLSTQITVDCDTLLVPTGFSPNADGVNDGYVIDGIENYPGNKLWVYNRWGALIYKTKDYKNNWNGIGNIPGVSKGEKVPSGTYYFILDLNDKTQPKAGYLIIKG